jgi:hypothetical protein
MRLLVRNLRYHIFRVFGCPAYIHVSEKRTRLEPSSIKGIFVGYGETSQVYRI